MKRIVNGVTYNTDTSTRVAESRWEREEDEQIFGTLYQTKGRAFFVDKEITRKGWNEFEQNYVPEVIHEFEPLSLDDAHKWMLAGEVEVFSDPFGEEPPEATAEAEPGTTLYMRVPPVLKKRADDAARAANVSTNVYLMRCLESCLGTPKQEAAAATATTIKRRKIS